jgi:Tol biopolymer transport system component
MAPKRGPDAREEESLAAIRRAPQRAIQPGLGLAEVLAVWALFGLFGAAIFWTYARLPARDFFHVSTSGPSGGAGRALVFLDFPTALVAIAIVLVVADRLDGRIAGGAGIVAIGLCAAVYWPGVVDQTDLDARWINAVAALGVAIAFGLTLAAARGGASAVAHAPGDRLRLLLVVAILVLGVEYVTGEFGVFINRIPGLGSVYWAQQPWAPFGHANLRPAVHLGHHHGFDGALLALAALALSRVFGTMRRRRLQAFLGLYLAVMFAYGLANEVQDAWGEQLVKRGVLDWAIPGVLVPAATPEFAAVIGAGLLLYLLVFRRLLAPWKAQARRVPMSVFALAACAVVVLAALGASAEGKTVRTPPPDRGEQRALRDAGEIAFPMVEKGWRIFVTNGDGSGRRNLTPHDHTNLAPRWSRRARLLFQSDREGNPDIYVGRRRLTDDPAKDGEPAPSPDGREIAFVSTRDGNREIYVMRADGAKQRRLTRNQARDEWPGWSPGGGIVFQSDRDGDFDLYVMNPDGSRLRRLTHVRGDERTPAWSPNGSMVAFASDRAGSSDLYVVRADGSGLRRLTRSAGEDFAPAWSPDGRLLVFGSDRDGRDQLFVVRADGSGLARLTDVQADKDAPDWR